jgi:hypothetical protein
MRTTITLDDDVAVRLERLRKERGESLKQLVNRLLRAGFGVLDDREHQPPRQYITPPVSLGLIRVPRIDDVAEVLAVSECEEWR